jgi:hypothetical protein
MIVWYLDLELHMQSVPITTKAMSSNPLKERRTQYLIREFWKVCSFPPPIKLSTTVQLKYCWKVALNTITLALHNDHKILWFANLFTTSVVLNFTQAANQANIWHHESGYNRQYYWPLYHDKMAHVKDYKWRRIK